MSFDRTYKQTNRDYHYLKAFNFVKLKEKRRIQEAGGFVSLNGVWRVQGVLATSRALGDFPLKVKLYIPGGRDPYIFQITPPPLKKGEGVSLTPNHSFKQTNKF